VPRLLFEQAPVSLYKAWSYVLRTKGYIMKGHNIYNLGVRYFILILQYFQLMQFLKA